jgi:hypothetical protein
MPNGPQRLVLINAGRYDYADVELRGSLQIVGPNNTGKTTLINTLQFLYLDDRRHMEFGSYTLEQTWDYYFPNQYSYVLFEVLGARGTCVIGWRGQTRVIGPEPERFIFDGPFDRSDFLDGDQQVRQAKDVSSRLSLKNYRVLKNAQEHRELLLLSTKGESRGLGLVVLRDNDRYAHFRETLKSLLCLSTISQDQMRGQVLMLAGFSADRQALNIREMFGDDYDHILAQKQKLVRFKKQQRDIELLLQASARRKARRGELASRWRNLRSKRETFEQNHNAKVRELTADAESAALDITESEKCIKKHQGLKDGLTEKKGSISGKLADIEAQAMEFGGFADDLARSALRNIQSELRDLENMLRDAEKETREKALLKHHQSEEIVKRLNHAIAHFDRALITFLRSELKDTELEPLSRLFNFDLLELTVGDGAVFIRSRSQLAEMLRLCAARIAGGIYKDENISLPLPAPRRSLSELENVTSLRERLEEEEQSLQKWVAIIAAIEQRDSLRLKVNTKREQLEGKKDAEGREIEEGLAKQLFRFDEYQTRKLEEPRLKSELKEISSEISDEGKEIEELTENVRVARERESTAKSQIKTERDNFAAQVKAFGECSSADFPDVAVSTDNDFHKDFSASVQEYLEIQEELCELDSNIESALQRLEVALGPDYAGSDESETIQRFREETEALPEREDVLRRDWQHQLTGLQATFDQILRSLADIKSAADRLNRDFSTIQVSNLTALKMEVQEQTDIVGSMRRLAKIEQPGLFDDSTGFEATIATFRSRFEATPILRYQELFTLQFTVTGEDGKPHHYQNFRQVESDGTTITIKVLFNLLVLRSLLREDSQRNLLCEIPFFLDEIYSLDAVNRHAILATARKLGFIAITAAPESVSEVDALYFLQPQRGRIVVKNSHRVSVLAKQRGA